MRRLRGHQVEALAAIENALTVGPRATLVLPAGSGKTLVAAKLACKAPTSALTVVPSLALLDQTLNEFATLQKDRRVVVAASKIAERHSFKSLVRSTKVSSLAETFAQDDPILCFSTYHSLPKVVEATRAVEKQFDLAIFDEAHVTTYNSKGTYVLGLADDFPASKRLFMTATPRIRVPPAKKKKKKPRNSMDDLQTYGPIAYELSAEEANARGVTVPLTVLVVDASNAYEYFAQGTTRSKKRRVRKLAQTALRDAELAAVLRKIRDDHGATRAFCFHNSNQRAADFVDTANSFVDDIHVDRVDGTMVPEQREAVLSALREDDDDSEKLKVVANSRLLGTGVDVPRVDAVVVAEPRRSHVDIAQMAGRAARPAPGKVRGLVVVPVRLTKAEATLDDVTAPPPFGPDDFDTVLSVLRALAADDERVAHNWRAAVAAATISEDDKKTFVERLNTELKGRGHVVFDVADDEVRKAVDKGLRLAALTLAGTWEDRYAELRAYQKKFGHVMVPTKYTTDNGSRLGYWVNQQRHFRLLGHLDPEKEEKLNAIGFVWVARDASWHHFFRKWRDGSEDASWVFRQRDAKRRGKLREDRERLLEAAGFDWGTPTVSPPLRDIFDDALRSYVAFVKKHGYDPEVRATAPLVYRDAATGQSRIHHVTLGAWVRAMRRGKLSDVQRRNLEAAGFVFEPRRARFETFLDQLRDFKAHHGHTLVPQNFPVLGYRVNRIRSGHLKLSDDQKRRLDDLGFDWARPPPGHRRRPPPTTA